MEVLTLKECFLRSKTQKSATIKISKDGIAIKTADNKLHTIEKGDIKDAELFYGIIKMTMRIFTCDLYEICNVDQNHIDELKRVFSEYFKINLYVKELEITDVHEGELGINAQKALEFRNKKVIFDIPIRDIGSVVDIKNEISISLDNVEIRFVSDKETINEIKQGCSATIDDEILSIEDLSLSYPRGKFNFVFFQEYFRLVGSSYDHKIYYKGVTSLYVLEKSYISNDEKYVLIGVEPAVRQGQTKYEFIVASFDDCEIEMTVDDERLKEEYSGLLATSFVEIMEALCVVKPIRSTFATKDGMRSLRCATKAYEGQLYPLNDCLLFLPRAIRLDLKSISLVEFSRINLSTMQAKTFDMTIFCNGAHTFISIPKEEFGALEQYFSDKQIKARSEIIEDTMSSDGDEGEYDSENDSIVVSSEED